MAPYHVHAHQASQAISVRILLINAWKNLVKMAARVLSYQDRTCARAQVITEEVTAKLRLISVQVVHVEMADYVSMESSGSPVNV